MTIKFGTDGWRAVIGDDYTYENVRQVIQAFCDLERRNKNKKIILGYDRRFSGKLFAEAAAEVFLGNNFQVLLSKDFCPTPAISWLTKHKRAAAGVVITASHNPFQWNGVKFKESYGGSASPEYTGKIEARVIKNQQARRRIRRLGLEEGLKRKKLKYFDPHGEYVAQLRRMVNVPKIRKAKLKVVFDAMHGAGAGFLPKLLGPQVHEIRGDENPCFGGVNPEPIAKNLAAAVAAVKTQRAHIALATDGDADRIGALDEKGRFVDSHRIFSLILRHLITVKKWKGDVVKSISTTQMVDRIAGDYGVNVIETPIGFKYICQEFLRHKTLMGGEESGGLGYAKHVFERDGILSALFLLEIMAHYRQPLSKIIQGLQKESGPLYFRRDDIHFNKDKIARVKKALAKDVAPRFPGLQHTYTERTDGFKYHFTDGSWLLIRPSGTEPLLRVYGETSSKRKTDLLVEAGERWLNRL